MQSGSKPALWARAVKTAEGVTAVAGMLFLLGGPLLAMHDRVNRMDQVLQAQGQILTDIQKTSEQREATIHVLSERLARIEEKVTEVRDRLREREPPR